MKILVTNGKFQQFTNAGTFAVGYKVYSRAAGTTTALVTYSDYLCTVSNTNPVVLDARGEAFIYVKAATDLYFTTPTGDYTTYIWKAEYVGYQEGLPPLLATVTPGTTHNNYVGTITPVAASIADRQMILMTPDVTNADTLVSTTFTGTGINDGVFTGPYTGTLAGSIFSVQIDGVEFQGTGLSDVTWGGTPLTGHVYTVKISTAAGTDKFQWRKDGGAWSAEANITGVAQALVDGVTVTFGATTGHTLADLWNNINTFKWRKDAGAWTEGVAITAAAQTLQEGIVITYAQKLGHTLNDLWALEVETSVRFNFCALGNKIVYKNVAGILKALAGGDLVQDIPVTLVYSQTQDCFVLNNPSLPVLSTLKPYRERVDLIAAYTITDDDIGKELSCVGTWALTFPACATIPNNWGWVRNSGSGTITLTANGTERIKYDLNTTGYTTMPLYPGEMVMWVTNGVDIHVAGVIAGRFIQKTTLTSGTTFTTQSGTRKIFIQLIGGGAGGRNAGGGGGGGAYAEKTFNVTGATNYTYAIGAAGAIGGAGGNTTFIVGATTVTAFGAAAVGGEPGGIGGITPTNGDFNANGANGGLAFYADAAAGVGGYGANSMWGGGGAASGGNATGYGAGGGGGAPPAGGGAAGSQGCIIVTEYS